MTNDKIYKVTTLTCDWRGKVLSQPSRQESSTLSPMVSVLGLLQLPHSAHPVCHQGRVSGN